MLPEFSRISTTWFALNNNFDASRIFREKRKHRRDIGRRLSAKVSIIINKI